MTRTAAGVYSGLKRGKSELVVKQRTLGEEVAQKKKLNGVRSKAREGWKGSSWR